MGSQPEVASQGRGHLAAPSVDLSRHMQLRGEVNSQHLPQRHSELELAAL